MPSGWGPVTSNMPRGYFSKTGRSERIGGSEVKAERKTIQSAPAENGARTILNFQQVGEQRYFDAAGFPGRTLGLELDGKQKTAGR